MNKTKHCLNCNSIVKGNYCSHCGQSANFSRTTPKELMEELQYGILHVNKGLLYTTKELLLRPGNTINNYLVGKRVKYTKPFVFLLIWGAIYSVVFHLFHYFPMEELNDKNNEVLGYIPFYDWASSHYSFVSLILTPVYALCAYWLFHRKGYNYAEHLVVFSYMLGTTIFLILLSYPLIYLSKSVFIYKGAHFLIEIYLIWGLAQFYKTSSWLKAIAKVVLCVIIVFMVLIILTSIVFEIFKYYDIRL